MRRLKFVHATAVVFGSAWALGLPPKAAAEDLRRSSARS